MTTEGAARGPAHADLQALAGFIFDMDGVIYRGEVALPGAASLIARLRRASVPFLYLTNNSTAPADLVAQRLTGMGIPTEAHEVLTSADVTAAALADQMPGGRVYLVGEEGIRRALLAAGFSLAADHRETDLVVVGLDRQSTYAKMREAALAINRGAPLFATNTDPSLPTEAGLIPGAGSLVGMLEIATGVRAIAFGKPQPAMFQYALRHLPAPAELTAAVGDRPDTDVVGAQRAGLRVIAVLTGAGTREAFAALQPPPDWVFQDLPALSRAYFGSE